MRIHYALILTAAVALSGDLRASDLGSYGQTKWTGYTQTSTSTPISDATNGYQFYSNIDNGSTGTILSSTTLTPPAGATGSVSFTSDSSGLHFQQFFSTKAQLDAAFPDGTYTYVIKTSTPNTYNEQQATGADAYPPAPQLTTPGATWSNGNLQVDPTQPYTFTWPGYNSPGGNGMSFTISNSSGTVVTSSQAGDGTPGTYTLPANTLQANATYAGYIQYGNGSFQSQLNFTIQTGPLSSNNNGVNITKGIQYEQSGTATPTLDPEEPYQFYANLDPGTTGSLLLTSTLTPPSGSTGKVNFQLGSNGLQFQQDFATQSALDTAFENGTYQVEVQTSAPSTITGQLTFGPETFPPIPQISNTNWANDALQIDPTQDFTLTFNSYNNSSDGGIFLDINNTDFSPGTPANGATSIVIPAGTLQANQLYQAQLGFGSSTGQSTTLGDNSSANFQTSVQFLIQTGTVSVMTTRNDVSKQNTLLQSSNSNPVNFGGVLGYQDTGPYDFSCEGTALGTITGPSVSIPLAFSASSNGKDFRFLSAAFATQAAMDAKYPNGTYKLVDGNTVSLTGNTYPNVPKVTAVNGAVPVWDSSGRLQVDPTIANTFAWTAFAGSNFATNGHISATFESTSDGELEIKKQAGISSGTTTPFNMLTVPAGTMTLGHTYVFNINYALATAYSNPTPNVYDIADYQTTTYLDVIATPATNVAQTIAFPAIGTIPFSATPITLNATASSGLPVAFSVSGPASVSGSQLTLTGTGSVIVTASQGGNGTYAAAPNVTQTITVTAAQPASQTISFPAVGAQALGNPPITLSATASSGLPVTFVLVSGPASLSGDTLTLTGAGSVVVEATQAGDSDFKAATPVKQTIAVAKEAQTITFPAISDQTFPASPIALGATASSGLAVTYTVSGPARLSGSTLTLTGAGNVVVHASQAGNANFAEAPVVTQTFAVGKGTQTIDFPAISNTTYGVAPFALNATATSGLPVVFRVLSGPALISGTKITIIGGGMVVVEADQAGNASVAAAAPVTQSFTVGPEAQTITFKPIGNVPVTEMHFTVVATASSRLPVTFSVVSGPASVTGMLITISGGGVVTVQASQAGNASFQAAPSVQQSFTVEPVAQTIKFATVPAKVFGDAPFALSATASSDLPVTFAYVSGPATLAGDEVTITGAGTVIVEADQAGDASYAAASVAEKIVVAKAPQSIDFTAVTGVTFGDAPITLSATATSGLAVGLTVTGPGTLNGNTLTITGAGAIVVTASQAGDDNYLAAPKIAQHIAAAKEAQTITFPAVGNPTYPSAPITLGATASSGLAVTYTVTGPASVSGSTLTLKGAGTVIIKASQVGNADFTAAPVVTQTVTVAP
jgi:hypothetical protein